MYHPGECVQDGSTGSDGPLEGTCIRYGFCAGIERFNTKSQSVDAAVLIVTKTCIFISPRRWTRRNIILQFSRSESDHFSVNTLRVPLGYSRFSKKVPSSRPSTSKRHLTEAVFWYPFRDVDDLQDSCYPDPGVFAYPYVSQLILSELRPGRAAEGSGLMPTKYL